MITIEEMRNLEAQAERHGVSRWQLMQNAGKQAARVAAEGRPPYLALVLCYHGNNGGDGFVMAEELAEKGWKTTVAFLGSMDKFKADGERAFGSISGSRIIAGVAAAKEYAGFLTEQDIIVDAMLGTGASTWPEGLREPLRSAVAVFNACAARKISLDVPTGIGTEHCCRPDLIIAFHDEKRWYTNGDTDATLIASIHAKTVIVDIGIPASQQPDTSSPQAGAEPKK
ncbi:NAD(P)H-hydrate epimerase [Candidatus Woesearchaeota archaeon CG1_02_57_44]|nr:MAG: NAD(P)H-hydrate epimerase [Candidatus Woesearchaeota archaeon CG1_02_57_44]